jgi:hypothetical protein
LGVEWKILAVLVGVALVSTVWATVTADQLAQATTLARATLPDGTKLGDDNWQAEFEEWREKQEAEAGGQRDEGDERDDEDGEDDD